MATAKDWQIDELTLAGPEHLDPAFVAAYDRKQGFDPSEDLAVLREHGVTGSSTLVDLGAGTGRLALAAARQVRRVVAVDVSPVMVQVIRERASEAGLPNLQVIQAGFLSYTHADPPADAAYTRNALHHLPDFWKGIALERISRLLKPRGILCLRDLIYDFQPSEVDAVLDRWFANAADDPTRGYTRADFAEHVRGDSSTYRWLLEPMLAAAGFEILTADFRQSVYGAYTCVKADPGKTDDFR
jgi:ubiquinone/menaquinone biosynthesis C-methylase UbiE